MYIYIYIDNDQNQCTIICDIHSVQGVKEGTGLPSFSSGVFDAKMKKTYPLGN